MTEFGLVSNEELRREHLPPRDDGQMTWISFALTFDGYEEKGDFDKCAAFADATRARWESSGELPSNITDLRTALYFEQRRWRWGDGAPFTEDEWRYWHAAGEGERAVTFLLFFDVLTPFMPEQEAHLARKVAARMTPS
jgi:hypothetical protein